MGPQSPARHRRLSARPCAPAELPELGASTAAEGRGAARGRAAERRWRSASRSADRPRLPPGKLKASFTMRTRENRTAASRGGGPWGGGAAAAAAAKFGVGTPVNLVRDAPGASGPTRTLLTLRLVYYTHMLPSRGARRRQGDTATAPFACCSLARCTHGAADACPRCPHLDTHITVSSVTHTAHARPAASLRPSPFAQTSALHTPLGSSPHAGLTHGLQHRDTPERRA